MPLATHRPDLFPDDPTLPPASGSPEQAALLRDELEFGTERFLERLEQLSDTALELYEELGTACLSATAEALPGRALRVLDLASGAGFVSLKLLEIGLPVVHLTLADLSSELMRRARNLLGARVGTERLPPLACTQLDLLVDDPSDRLTGPFDLIVCSNGFQHFPRERQAELCRGLHRLLAPSGVLVLGSHFKPLCPAWKEELVAGYMHQLQRHQATDELLAMVSHHIRHFHVYANLREVYEWLEAAGFGVYDCTFRKRELGIFVAIA